MELEFMRQRVFIEMRNLIGKYLMEKPIKVNLTSEGLVMDIASQVANYNRDKTPATLEQAITYLREGEGDGVIKFGYKDIYKRTMDLCNQRIVRCPASSRMVEKIGTIIHEEKVKIINNINDTMPYIPAVIKEACKMRISKVLSAIEGSCVYSNYAHHIKVGEIEANFENDILFLSKKGILLIQVGDSNVSLRAFALRRMMAEIPGIENNIHSIAYIENPGPNDVTTRNIKVFSDLESLKDYIKFMPYSLSSETFNRVKDRLEEERIPPIGSTYTKCLNNYYGYYMDLAILENKWKKYIEPIEREAQREKEARRRKESKVLDFRAKLERIADAATKCTAIMLALTMIYKLITM